MQTILRFNTRTFWITLATTIVIGMLTCYVILNPPASANVKINSGFLDLSQSSVSETPHKLQGEWEFYWNELLTPDDFYNQASSLDKPRYFISIPGSWRDFLYEDEKLGGTGFATFRLIIQLNEADQNESLAFRIPPIFHSYKLWVNGQLLSEVGEVGKDLESTKPHLMTKLIFYKPDSDKLELVMQIANFEHKRGGITKIIELGSGDSVNVLTNINIAAEVFVTATLLIIGCYHLLLFFLRRKDRATLYFGLFTLFFGLRSLFVGEVMITQLIPNFPWSIQFKIEYLVLCICPLLLRLYFNSIYPNYVSRWFNWLSRISSIGLFSIVFVTPSIIYTQLLIPIGVMAVLHAVYLMFGLIDAIRRKMEGSGLLLAVSVVLLIAVVNDFMYYSEWSPLENMFPLGLLIFTLVQMFLLSSRFTKAVANEERITRELQDANYKLVEMNINLEKIVRERTHDLSIAHEELSMSYDKLLLSEEGRKKLLAYITHDLRMPLASMLGYVEAVQDMVKPERNEQYLKYIRDNTIKINRMIEELSYLSHLETGQVAYDMKPIPIVDYIENFYKQYELVVRDADVQFRFDMLIKDKQDNDLLLVLLDEKKLERALFNLVSNAMKFTEKGGMVRIALALEQSDTTRHVIVMVEDTGVGIPPELLNQIFDRNYKYCRPGTENVIEGSGLGLAICREIVQAHKGTVKAESDGKNGTIFYVALPCINREVIE